MSDDHDIVWKEDEDDDSYDDSHDYITSYGRDSYGSKSYASKPSYNKPKKGQSSSKSVAENKKHGGESTKASNKNLSNGQTKVNIDQEPILNMPLTESEREACLEAAKRADYETMQELFEGLAVDQPPIVTLPNEMTFEQFKPQSKQDFEILAKYLGSKLASHQSSFYYRHFLNTLITTMASNMLLDDLQEVSFAFSKLIADKSNTQVGEHPTPSTSLSPDNMLDDFM